MNRDADVSVHPDHSHPHEALSGYRLRVLVQPRLFERMTNGHSLPQALPNHGPSLAVVVQPEYTYELLEVVVHDGMVHARVDIVKRVRDDRVPRRDVRRDPRGREQSRRVHTQSAKITDHEPRQAGWFRQRVARQRILGVRLESNTVLEHRWKEGREEDTHEPV